MSSDWSRGRDQSRARNRFGVDPLPNGDLTWLSNNAHRIVDWVPEPGDPWVSASLDIPVENELGFLRMAISKNVLQTINRDDPRAEKLDEYPSPEKNIYLTDRKRYEMAKTILEKQRSGGTRAMYLPCGHRGVRTISTDGEGEYSCVEDYCEETFTRAETREALE